MPMQTVSLHQLRNGIVRAWKWSIRWFVWVWVGFPLGFAIMGYRSHLSQYADVYAVARQAPRITRIGVLTRPDARGSKLLLKTSGGGKYPVRCNLDAYASYCVRGNSFPLSAKVTTFKYRGFEIIVHVEDTQGRSIISESKRMGQIKGNAIRYSADTERRSATAAFLAALALDPILVLCLYGLRVKDRRSANRRMTK